jgi:hypothetical protein
MEDWKKRYPAIIGVKGVHDFHLKFATGEIIPFGTEEEEVYWAEQMMTDDEILEYFREKEINKKKK